MQQTSDGGSIDSERYLDSRRIATVIVLMALMVYGVAGLAIWIIYNARLEQYRANLLASAQNKISLLEHITHSHIFDDHSPASPHAIDEDFNTGREPDNQDPSKILSHLANAITHSGSFRQTGENVLGYYEGDDLYIFSSREPEGAGPYILKRADPLPEPLRRALAGDSGTIIAKDYRDKKVIAALVPLPKLDAAVVVKMDMSEFSAPYRRAIIVTLLLGTVWIIIYSLIFWREGRRIISKLAFTEDRYRTLMDNVPLCVFLKDGNGNYLTANRYFYLRYGVNKKTIPRMTDQAIFPPETASQHLADDQRVLNEGITLTGYETQFLNGDERIIRYLKCPLKNNDGDTLGIIGIHQDVTQDRRNSEALRKLNAQLESQVRLRTAQYEVANRELESFAYSVSHDLRAPLRAMAGFSEALKEEYGEKFDQTAADYISRILRATHNMAELIDSLLSLSRSTTGELKIAPLDISSLSQQVVDDLRQADPGHCPEVVIAPDLSAEGDNWLIRNVLENLIGNAWKYTSKTPSARIEIGSTRATPPGEGSTEQEVFYVRDNGSGFDMAYVNKLFRPFQRIHTQKEYQGSGIGLATVERIIHRHNGQIWADSAPERGATFFFTLDHLSHADHES
ncbi:PAS domain-containing protein [Ruficoccus amylovorans]|uniref:histidine kinase n=1 Tax=Ruficoccus amylovorans TaxID=1804625 RepID=A0A842HDS7_9BACT|nr:ATP-binding protein [Ruficoccus amylovorans]MBC2594673.1 PAS domain-containing protein [Ruficoccus amylovorans]